MVAPPDVHMRVSFPRAIRRIEICNLCEYWTGISSKRMKVDSIHANLDDLFVSLSEQVSNIAKRM